MSDKVGQVKNDSADLIVPIDSKKSSITHFLTHQDPFSQAEKVEKDNSKRKDLTDFTIMEKRKRFKSTPKITQFFNKNK